ncbi:hypothetical protein P3102_22645 [Amycolatopsis sp. QT-25]|uniref:hypothetical protein n=1 Tax=Amycolatopsis sp. QT-25 TaxID=3034022 RepID=UPI0023EB2F4A|nr:hypothetical protein [Amycolatopsis sp. QT-25]WET76904.1 hypothetical protein P3102_22645 [Amycolatopsis sp. QT-25]
MAGAAVNGTATSAGAGSGGHLLLLVLAVYAAWKLGRAFVGAYDLIDNLPPRPKREQGEPHLMSRFPLRVAGSIVGALTALVSGLVGSGLFTADQGSAVTGIITGVITLLATFGVVVSTEKKVTPLVDPRDQHGDPLVTAPAPKQGKPLDWGTFDA